MDAVEKAVNSMEDNPNFNAGHGAVLNEIGRVECDAMIMDGSTMNSGITIRPICNIAFVDITQCQITWKSFSYSPVEVILLLSFTFRVS